ENKFAAASQSLAASLKENPTWRQADETLLLLARAQAKEGKASEARANLERFASQFPDSRVLDEAYFRLGDLLDSAGDYKTAASTYTVIATKFGDSQYAPYALYGKGWAEVKRKE